MSLFKKKYRSYVRLGMRHNFNVDSDVSGYPVEITNLLFHMLQIAPAELKMPEVVAVALIHHCELHNKSVEDVIKFARENSKAVTDPKIVFNKPKL